MKQQIITEIKEKLEELGVPMQFGNETDISISTELLDAKWSTGGKKIRYEAYILVNDREHVVNMYEKTMEAGGGFSFGMSTEASFQSGSTLYRKVKSIQYGLDGKAFEYTFDLGAIPKAVKDAAKRSGWKFKTVLNKNKALYLTGV